MADTSLYSYVGDTFSYDLNSSGSLPDGPVSAAFRAVEDGYGGYVYGSWQNVSFDFQSGGSGYGGPNVTVTQSATQVTEGSAVTFQLQSASGGNSSGTYVDYEILPGTAPSAEAFFDVDKDIGVITLDYSTGQGILTINAIDDTTDEYDENFKVKLTAYDYYGGNADLGTFDVQILDNDNAPTVSLQRIDPSGNDEDVSGNALTSEVPEHDAVARFNVMFSHPSQKMVSLN